MILYAEFNNGGYYEVRGKETENIPVESFAVGNVAKGDFILVNMAGKRSISCYMTEVMKYFHGNGNEIRYCIRLDNTNIQGVRARDIKKYMLIF